jgi:hypothetical protein
VSIASFANVASATPIADALAIKNAAPTGVETVRGGRGGWGRGGGGWGIGAGLLGAAIIGEALAAPYYGYAPGPYDPYAGAYGPPPGYYGRGPWGSGRPLVIWPIFPHLMVRAEDLNNGGPLS